MKQILFFFQDREYYQLLKKLALPITLQNLFMAGLNMGASIMVGQLGDSSVAAVSLANQVMFLLNLLVFGIVSGTAIFLAQFWGKQDIEKTKSVLGIAIKLSLLASLIFWLLAFFSPGYTLRIYTDDPVVIEIGSQYLRIISWAYFFQSVSYAYSVGLRSTGNVRLPLFVSTLALILNIALSYPLIFGVKFLHFPGMGVNGSAVGYVIARFVELVLFLSIIYRDKFNPAAVSLHEIFSIDWSFLSKTLKPVLPVITNEILWSFGITAYSIIYGHIGTEAVAAVKIVSDIDQVAFVIFIGLGTATSIMVGNAIGEGNKNKAYIYAGRSLVFQAIGAILMGLVVFLFGDFILKFYKVTPKVISDAHAIITVLALGMWVRAQNVGIFIGILRSGGDTKFALVLDGLMIWLVGVPITALGAFYFHLPVYYVYALTFCEEITKGIAGLHRFFSKKWINDLTIQSEN